MIENEVHLGDLGRTRCGTGNRTVDEAALPMLAAGGWETPICPQCVALVISERERIRTTSDLFMNEMMRLKGLIAKARKLMRSLGIQPFKAHHEAYRALDTRARR